MDNPLLTPSDLPPFDRIGAQDVAPAIDVLLERASQALETVTAPGFPARWQAIMEQLEVPNEQLLRAWGAISHLNSVAHTPPLPPASNPAPAPGPGPHPPFETAGPPPRHCGPPTTPPCRASPNSGPAWAPTSGCTPSTRPSAPRHCRPCKARPPATPCATSCSRAQN